MMIIDAKTYETLRDFQPLCAALFAFAAAVVALISSLLVAGRQAKSARESVREKHTLDVEDNKKQQILEQRAFAISLKQRVAQDVHALLEKNLDLRGVEHAIDTGRMEDTATRSALRRLLDDAEVTFNPVLVSWKELSVFDTDLQTLFWQANHWENIAVNAHSRLKNAALDTKFDQSIFEDASTWFSECTRRLTEIGEKAERFAREEDVVTVQVSSNAS